MSMSLLHIVLQSRLFSSWFHFHLPANNYFFSINAFFANSVLLQISFVQYPSLDIKLPSGSGSVSGNVLQRMSCHMEVTVNSDGRTCNAEAVHK